MRDHVSPADKGHPSLLINCSSIFHLKLTQLSSSHQPVSGAWFPANPCGFYDMSSLTDQFALSCIRYFPDLMIRGFAYLSSATFRPKNRHAPLANNWAESYS